ncbi:hypothetical protein [Pandoraea sputorum]|uniref:hypothetical protein n=1 Tax=Pandoraea sputorum TaxID=93222 RepID=UPI002AF6A10F|nr:hypothetical protein [Pandoraea sputorum]
MVSPITAVPIPLLSEKADATSANSKVGEAVGANSASSVEIRNMLQEVDSAAFGALSEPMSDVERLRLGETLHCVLGKIDAYAASRLGSGLDQPTHDAFRNEIAARSKSLQSLMYEVTMKVSEKREKQIGDLLQQQAERQAHMADLHALQGALSQAVAGGVKPDPETGFGTVTVPLGPNSPIGKDVASVQEVIDYYKEKHPEFGMPGVPMTGPEAEATVDRVGSILSVRLQGLVQNDMVKLQDLYTRFQEVSRLGSNFIKVIHDTYRSTIN